MGEGQKPEVEVEVEARGLLTMTGAMHGEAPESLRNTIAATAVDLGPKLGVRVAVTIIRGDGVSALAMLDVQTFNLLADQYSAAGERATLMAAPVTGKAN